MMDAIADVLAAFCLFAGLAFMLVGAVGILRFPDAFNRLHATSKCSTLGLLGLLLGAIFFMGTVDIAVKAGLTMIFAFVATPVGSHILAKAAHMNKLKQWEETLSDELQDDKDAADKENNAPFAINDPQPDPEDNKDNTNTPAKQKIECA